MVKKHKLEVEKKKMIVFVWFKSRQDKKKVNMRQIENK